MSCGLAVVVWGVSVPAFAQSRNVSVTERPHPAYDAPGIHVPGFMLHAAVTLDYEYNDNIFATEKNRVSDHIFNISESVAAASTWSRHSLDGGVVIKHRGHFDESAENYTDLTLFTNGTIDLYGSSAIGAGAMYEYLAEPRSYSSSPGSAIEPIRYTVLSGNVNASHRFNRASISGRFDVRDFNFMDGRRADGTSIDQDDRDRVHYIATVRTEYEATADTSVFIEGSYNYRVYDDQPPIVAFDRDSHGYRILAGTEFDVTRLIRGSVGFGYFSQEFDDPSLGDVSGLAARANVEWFVSGLTTVNAGYETSVGDSGLVGSSSFVASTAKLGVDHELLRNVVISASARYRGDDFDGIDRDDETLAGRLGIRYLVNRYATIDTYYAHEYQNSRGSAAGRDYHVNRVGISLSLEY